MATITTVEPFAEVAFPSIEVPDDVLKALDENGLSITHITPPVNECGRYIIDVGGHTRGGTEMGHMLFVGDTENPREWAEAFERMVLRFDPWEVAHVYLDKFGKPKPGMTRFSSGYALYMDIATYEREVLDATLYDLDAVATRRYQEAMR